MTVNKKDVNEVLEIVVDSALTAHDAQIGATEDLLRRETGLNGSGQAEAAYESNVDAINEAWRAAVEAAFWTGYKRGRDGA